MAAHAHNRRNYNWERQKIYNYNIDEYSKYDFEGTLDSLIDQFNQIKAEHGNTWNDLGLETEIEEWYYDEKLVKFKLTGWRWETDEEFNTRIANQEKWLAEAKEKRKLDRQLKKDAEYEQYQKLKKKFEKV